MAWNEPGGGDKDPWGRKNNDGPPDIDEVFKKLKDNFAGIFGGNKGSSGGSEDNPDVGAFPIYIVLVLLGAIWVFQSFYTIDEKERAVVLRFGEFSRVFEPGLNFAPWLIDTVEREFVTSERQYTAAGDQSRMLTKDENLVQVPLTVQYNIKDIRDFVLNVKDPEETLEQATDSAIRHVVGSTNLDAVLGEGRERLASEVEIRLQDYLDSYGTGIDVIDVTLQRGEPPEEVRKAFDDVNVAEQDQQRSIDQAEAYRNSLLPKSRGEAQKLIEEANAYAGQLVAKAEGEASRFTKLLEEYERAPEVTRERLYLDAIETVYANTSKVMVDVEGGNNLLYLPLDQIAKSRAGTGGTGFDAQEIRDIRAIFEQEINKIRANSSSGGR